MILCLSIIERKKKRKKERKTTTTTQLYKYNLLSECFLKNAKRYHMKKSEALAMSISKYHQLKRIGV